MFKFYPMFDMIFAEIIFSYGLCLNLSLIFVIIFALYSIMGVLKILSYIRNRFCLDVCPIFFHGLFLNFCPIFGMIFAYMFILYSLKGFYLDFFSLYSGWFLFRCLPYILSFPYFKKLSHIRYEFCLDVCPIFSHNIC